MTTAASDVKVNIRMKSDLYRAVERIARQEHHSVSQTAGILVEEALHLRFGGGSTGEDTPAAEILTLAAAGGAFDWLQDEPDLYNDACGEPV